MSKVIVEKSRLWFLRMIFLVLGAAITLAAVGVYRYQEDDDDVPYAMEPPYRNVRVSEESIEENGLYFNLSFDKVHCNYVGIRVYNTVGKAAAEELKWFANEERGNRPPGPHEVIIRIADDGGKPPTAGIVSAVTEHLCFNEELEEWVIVFRNLVVIDVNQLKKSTQ